MCDTSHLSQEGLAARCICREAVERAYACLVGTGVPNRDALMIAQRVYRHHHPEDTREQAQLAVERWVTRSIH